MKLTRLLIIFVFLFNITTCNMASSSRPFPKTPYYQQLINTWIGAPLNELVRKWVKPHRTYSKNNRKYIVINVKMRFWAGGKDYYSTSQWQDEYCIYKFEVSRRNIIVSGTARGYTCPLYKDEITRGVVPGTTRPNSEYRDR